MSLNKQKYHGKSGFYYQLMFCNILLIIFGMTFVGLSFTQFFEIGLDNYRQIDLRALNYFHILIGLAGLICVSQNRGNIILKALYIVSFVLAISTFFFYVFTTIKMINSYHQLLKLESVMGFVQMNGLTTKNFPGKVSISCVLIGIGLLTAFTAILAAAFLNKLLIAGNMYKEIDRFRNGNSFTFILLSIVKLLFGLCALGLAFFIEYERQVISSRNEYIQIALDHIAALFTIISSLADLHAHLKVRRSTLNYATSIGLSIISAVWCLKTVDNNMFPYYKNDINIYRTSNSLHDIIPLTQYNTPQKAIILAHGIMIGIFSILFISCSVSAVIVADYFFTVRNKIMSRKTLVQGRLLNAIHVFWSILLIALVLIGFADIPWSGDFVGNDLFWTAILFFCTGIIFSSNERVYTQTKFIMNVVSLSVAVEKCVLSINLIYQSASHSSYINENVTDQRTFVAQIILHSIQCFIFLGEILTSFSASYIYGRAISESNLEIPSSVNCLFGSIGAFVYGLILTICYILFEIGKWKFSEIPLEEPFYRLGNGPFALSVTIVQISAYFLPQLLLVSLLFQAIICSLALFIINSATTNIYYIYNILRLRESIGVNSSERYILIVALIITSVAALSCVICTISALFCLLSYTVREKSSKESTISILKLNESPPLHVQHQWPSPDDHTDDQFAVVANNSVHQISIQPIEEQTLYWSSEENPYIYKATKKFYYADSAYHSSYASPVSRLDDDQESIAHLEQPPRSGGNNVMTKTRIAYSTSEKVTR